MSSAAKATLTGASKWMEAAVRDMAITRENSFTICLFFMWNSLSDLLMRTIPGCPRCPVFRR